jgi:hypothetical protein
MQAARYPGILLKRDLPLAATGALSVLNGSTFSPFFDSVGYLLYFFARGVPFLGPDPIFYLTSLGLSLMTLLAAGIPAALYERIRGLRESTPVSLGIWLVAAALLTLPTLMRVLGED